MNIDATGLHYDDLNAEIKSSGDSDIVVTNAMGQRYIGAGTSGKTITVNGIPGNALGAYLNGSTVVVNGNAQDAIGDTMNKGEITIHGNCGDTTGYGMRNGKIFVKGNAGYRVGIHMKEYRDWSPTIVIGGKVGDFLGEYQAGGSIVVLGIGHEGSCPVGGFCATGMHGGHIYIRAEEAPKFIPANVIVTDATEEDKKEIAPHVAGYCEKFGGDTAEILKAKFIKLTPDMKNPFRTAYVAN